MPGITMTACAAQPALGGAQIHVLSERMTAPSVSGTSRLDFRMPQSLPPEIDLGSAQDQSLLSELDRLWPALSTETRLACLRQAEFTFAVGAPDSSEIVVLPGGVVALASPEGIRVPDPLSVTTYPQARAAILMRAARRCKSVITLLHRPDGVVAVAGVPDVLAPQSATIVGDISRLLSGAGLTGPALIQWGLAGATCWSMATAPSLVGLALRAAGLPLQTGESAIPAELWSVAGSAECRDLLAPGISEIISDALTDAVSDDLRYALIGRCVAGAHSLAASTAAVLSAIPACFEADCARWQGELPANWLNGAAILRKAAAGFAMLGMERVLDPHRALGALRKLLDGTDAQLFLETGTGATSPMVPVEDEAALFLVRRAVPEGRIGVLFACPEPTARDLYATASGLAASAGATVTVASAACGLRHCVGWDQREAGNAAWFGMGAGLDELEFFHDPDLLER